MDTLNSDLIDRSNERTQEKTTTRDKWCVKSGVVDARHLSKDVSKSGHSLNQLYKIDLFYLQLVSAISVKNDFGRRYALFSCGEGN